MYASLVRVCINDPVKIISKVISLYTETNKIYALSVMLHIKHALDDLLNIDCK